MVALVSSGSGCAQRRRATVVSAGTAVSVILWLLLLLADSPAAAALTEGQSTTKSDHTAVNTITIEAQRNRAELQRKVNKFLASVLVHHLDWALARWNQPVCPLVAGLSRDEGEFMLARLSEIVTAAGAPLGPATCKANFFVVVTPEPVVLLAKWRRRDPGLFDNTYGEAKVKRFINTARPIRIWYNAEFVGSDGTTFYADSLPNGGGASSGMVAAGSANTFPINNRARGSRLLYDDAPALSTAIVIVGSTHIEGLHFGQLADHIGMIGLAEVNLDKDLGDTPSILRLFAVAAEPKAAGLTVWDQAFLKSLYSTPQENKVQLSEMQSAAFRYLAQAQ